MNSSNHEPAAASRTLVPLFTYGLTRLPLEASRLCVLTTGYRDQSDHMEAVAKPPPDMASDRTANTGGGTASERLRVHAHLYKPRLKSSSVIRDFQSELRQYASKQGRNTALEYATALGTAWFKLCKDQQGFLMLCTA